MNSLHISLCREGELLPVGSIAETPDGVPFSHIWKAMPKAGGRFRFPIRFRLHQSLMANRNSSPISKACLPKAEHEKRLQQN